MYKLGNKNSFPATKEELHHEEGKIEIAEGVEWKVRLANLEKNSALIREELQEDDEIRVHNEVMRDILWLTDRSQHIPDILQAMDASWFWEMTGMLISKWENASIRPAEIGTFLDLLRNLVLQTMCCPMNIDRFRFMIHYLESKDLIILVEMLCVVVAAKGAEFEDVQGLVNALRPASAIKDGLSQERKDRKTRIIGYICRFTRNLLDKGEIPLEFPEELNADERALLHDVQTMIMEEIYSDHFNMDIMLCYAKFIELEWKGIDLNVYMKLMEVGREKLEQNDSLATMILYLASMAYVIKEKLGKDFIMKMVREKLKYPQGLSSEGKKYWRGLWFMTMKFGELDKREVWMKGISDVIESLIEGGTFTAPYIIELCKFIDDLEALGKDEDLQASLEETKKRLREVVSEKVYDYTDIIKENNIKWWDAVTA